MLTLREYVLGLICFGGTWGAVAVATTVIVRRRLRGVDGASLALAATLIFVSGVVAVELVPLILGILSRWTVLAMAVVAALVVVRAVRASEATAEPAPAAPRSGTLSWVIAGAAAGGLALATLAWLKRAAVQPVTAADFTFFHMPGVARWIQAGTVWQNIELLPGFSVGTYPNNGDVLFLSTVLPWREEVFTRLVNVPLLGLVGVAVYALARELRSPRATGVLLGAVVTSIYAVWVTALDRVKPETLMLVTFGAGALFLVRHARTRRTADLVLAGLGLGLAFGTRWNGVSAVVATVAVWAVVSWRVRSDARSVAHDAMRLVGLVAAAGGFWLIRNWVETGNPLFPEKVSALGVTVFNAPRDEIRILYGHTILQYLGNGSVLRHSILPDYRVALGAPGALLAVGVGLAVVLALVGRRAEAGWRREPVAALGLSIAAILIVAIYIATPASAQGSYGHPWAGIIREAARWAMPAAVMGGAVTAWAIARLGRGRGIAELIAAATVLDGAIQSFSVRIADAAIVVAALAGAAAVIFGGWTLGRRALRSGKQLVVVAATEASVLAVALAFAGWGLQRSYNHRRYLGLDPSVDWVLANAPNFRRIGVAGEFTGDVGFLYPLFGPRLFNHVSYVGRFDRGLLREYSSAPSFLAAVRRGRYDLLDVGRGVPPRPETPTQRWAASTGYVRVLASLRFALYASPGFLRRAGLSARR
ncbi:MAG TPA: glycosyltransferase family 39 protein [Solirubrobacteraceae bacterium]|nr:glycosyltransferase family 39 protein [Solirubrobacteraceae bacterium]